MRSGMNLCQLKELTLKHAQKLSYINIDKNGCYKGWVTDFRLKYKPSGGKISLNLKKEDDLFLLFVLASSWSKTGPWENALFFVAYLKTTYDINRVISGEIKITPNDEGFNQDDFEGIKTRKKVSFRKDFYDSVDVLLKNWDDIKKVLHLSEKLQNWKIFIEYISHLKGLGANENAMKIKIPFILRELRCQKIYSNIDGEYCCVADERVRKAYKSLKKKLPTNYLEASSKIYKDFGDLYDIPAFAYEDLINKGNKNV